MAMDSIKFRSVHLMDDGDGHHNFGIDGDGDGHHFKGDGRHVWCLLFKKIIYIFSDKCIIKKKQKLEKLTP